MQPGEVNIVSSASPLLAVWDLDWYPYLEPDVEPALEDEPPVEPDYPPPAAA